jgi:hypothetical protein
LIHSSILLFARRTCGSPLLRSHLEWGEPLGAAVVAGQLVAIAVKHARGAGGALAAAESGTQRATMAVQLPRIYNHLCVAVERGVAHDPAPSAEEGNGSE